MTPEEIAADAAQKKADAEALKKQIEEIRSKGTKIYSDEEMKEAIARRQEALDKVRAFEEKEAKTERERKKEEEDKLRKDGETKTLLERKEAELAKSLEDNKTLKEKADKADEQEKALREQTLAKIIDPDLKKMAGELSTTSLLAFAEKITTGKVLPASQKQELGKTPDDLYTKAEIEAIPQSQMTGKILEKVNRSLAALK